MFQSKTKGNVSPQGKRRVYFSCHPEDYERFFERISAEVLNITDCAVWYSTDEGYEDIDTDLGQMNLLVVPVTTKLLTKPCRTMKLDVPFVLEHHIPILPLMQEGGLDELFSRNFGDLQYLDSNARDETAISYEEKLKKYLNSVLVGDEMAAKVRAAFDAYIFLSYRKKDRKYANELMRLIHKNNFCRDIAIWYDEYLTPGENFNDAISTALQKSDLFTMVVTPNLVNETNYVESVEYPEAMKQKKPILPVELEKTNHDALSKHYRDIPNSVDVRNEIALSEALESTLSRIARRENNNDPQHNFFIGLAYLDGIDVEMDHERALSLITFAAESKEGKVPEAMEKLVSMYSEGHGVKRDYRIAAEWQKKLVEHWETEYHNAHSTEDYRKLFSSFLELGDQFYDIKDINAAESTYKQMLALSEQLAEEIGTVEIQNNIAVSYEKLGDFWKERKDFDVEGDEEFYQKAIAIRKQLTEETGTAEAKHNLAVCYTKLGELYTMRLLDFQQKTKEGALKAYTIRKNMAEDILQKAVAIREQLVKEGESADARLSLAFSYNKLGQHYAMRFNMDRVNSTLNSSILDKLHGMIGVIWLIIGSLFKMIGNQDMNKAKKNFRKALAIRKQLAKKTGTVTARNDLATSYVEVCAISISQLNIREIKKFCHKAITIRERLAEETESVEIRNELVNSYMTLANGYYLMLNSFLDGLGKFFGKNRRIKNNLEIDKIYRKAIAVQEQLTKETGKVKVTSELAQAYYYVAYLIPLGRGEPYDRELLEKSFALYTTLVEQYPNLEDYSRTRVMIASLLDPKLWEDIAPAEDRRILAKSNNSTGNYYKEQGDMVEAEKSYRESLTLWERLAEETGSVEDQRDLATTYNNLGDISKGCSYHEEAEEFYRKAITIREWLSEKIGTEEDRCNLVVSYNALGKLHKMRKDLDGTEELYRKALAIREQLAEESETVTARRNLADSYERLGEVCKMRGNLSDAEDFYRKSLVIRERLTEEVGTMKTRRNLADSYERLGDIRKIRDDSVEAEEFYRKSLALREWIAKESGTLKTIRKLLTNYDNLGDIRKGQGDMDGAEEFYRKSLTLSEQITEKIETVEARRDLSVRYGRLGDIRRVQGDPDSAENFYQKSLVLSEQLARETMTMDDRRNLWVNCNKLGDICKARGNLGKAEEFYRKGVALSKRFAEETETVQARYDLSISYNNFGGLCKAQGDLDRSEEFYRKSLALKEQIAEESGDVKAYDDLAFSYYTLAIIRKPHNRSFLEKALQINTTLAAQCPQVTRYSKNKDIIKLILEQMG